jgi:hypothetical protein
MNDESSDTTTPPDLHGAPTAHQLVEAVREWLERDVMTSENPRLSFNARVAVNVLAIVEREFELGPTQVARHAERLAELGCANDAELAHRIRSGDLDDRLDDVKRLVREDVVDKLRVANPKYLA